MSEPKISVNDLRVTFPGRASTGPVEALGGVTFQAHDNELVCIVGPSGCGKTTLLRVLAGLQQPTSGSATIRHDDPTRAAKAMVFQSAGVFPWMTVEQNVAYGLQIRGAAKAETAAVAHKWIAETGLQRFANAYPAQLSGGMAQRVGLARAFALDPEVLLMDEPFGALDAQTRLLLQQTLLELIENRESGVRSQESGVSYRLLTPDSRLLPKTVLFITHSIEEALTLADRVFVMSARPGVLLHEVHVPFERPRDAAALRTDPRMGALFADIWAVLRDEVERARASEMA